MPLVASPAPKTPASPPSPPGISGALLTTISGLLVAIPSVFGYNYLLTMAKSMAGELENFASNLADRIELEAREANGQPVTPEEPAQR